MARVWVTLYRYAMDSCVALQENSETLFRNNVIACSFGMNEQMKIFGANLQKHMNAREMSAAVLADKSGVSIKSISNVINGRHAAQIDKLAKLAEALDVEFWTMWIPGVAVAPQNDLVIQGLLETSVHLSFDALNRISRMAELELNSERSAARSKKSSASAENHPKR